MEQRHPRLRWLVVWFLGVVWMGAVLARLSYLQLFRHSEYLAKAEHQQQRVFEISPTRGAIYDRKGRDLAVSLPMDSLFADPAEIADVEMVAPLLSHVLDVPADEIAAKIRGARTPVRLARKLSPDSVQRIADMNLRGVFFQKENRRVYPQRELAASLLGYVDVDEKGIGGIEYALDKEIRGQPGRMMVMADGLRRWYDRRELAPSPGASVALTIDETIQYIAEKELARAVEQTHAKSGVAVVQDPNSGELLAVANAPSFDANNPGAYADETRMNRAVVASYEPGSTFKVITLTGALEHGVASPDDLVDCQMGSIVVGGRLIHDWHRFGVLSVRGILANSSDVGAIKLALRLGAPRFYETIRAFGIGQPTGIELPGENRGLLRPVENWSANSIGSLAMGQEVSVTPVQMISAISAVANGGTLYPPRIVREIGGRSPAVHSPAALRQVTDARTAAQMRELMEAVVLEGTGKPARLAGWTAAGKSGTAQKIDPATRRYSKTQYMASFVGFTPLNNPVVTILVVLDSPVGPHHGGEVGGPVFKRIAEQVLTYLNVPHDVPLPSDIETAKQLSPTQRRNRPPTSSADPTQAEFAAAVANAAQPASGASDVVSSDATAVVMPNLASHTVRTVTEACLHLGLVPTLVGSGVAVEQFPAAGTQVLRGTRVTVRFGRPVEFVPLAAHGSRN